MRQPWLRKTCHIAPKMTDRQAMTVRKSGSPSRPLVLVDGEDGDKGVSALAGVRADVLEGDDEEGFRGGEGRGQGQGREVSGPACRRSTCCKYEGTPQEPRHHAESATRPLCWCAPVKEAPDPMPQKRK